MTSLPINVLLITSIDAIRMLLVAAVEPALLKVLPQQWVHVCVNAFFPR